MGENRSWFKRLLSVVQKKVATFSERRIKRLISLLKDLSIITLWLSTTTKERNIKNEIKRKRKESRQVYAQYLQRERSTKQNFRSPPLDLDVKHRSNVKGLPHKIKPSLIQSKLFSFIVWQNVLYDSTSFKQFPSTWHPVVYLVGCSGVLHLSNDLGGLDVVPCVDPVLLKSWVEVFERSGWYLTPSKKEHTKLSSGGSYVVLFTMFQIQVEADKLMVKL